MRTPVQLLSVIGLAFVGYHHALSLPLTEDYVKNERLDISLMGHWRGSQFNKHNELRSWHHQRSVDGRYIIDFIYHGESQSDLLEIRQSGHWWTEDGVLYYQADQFRGLHGYRYWHISEDCVSYELIHKTSAIDVDIGYTFTECQKPSTNNPPREGKPGRTNRMATPLNPSLTKE
ncbi:hypothetical protein [Aurantivibrio plasticivorans]